MKRFLLPVLMLLLSGCHSEIRQPAVAGQFYPADPAVLSRAVDGYLSGAARVDAGGRLLALVSPHAGYEFSGAVAGEGFRQIQGGGYDTVIVLGPTHYFGFVGASVYTGDVFMTPLGGVRVDKAMAKSFMDAKAHIVYEPRAHEKEHSIEVEMPFLQRALGSFKVVPVVVGDPTRESLESLSGSIARALLARDKKTLLVVSTDWSHYHDYDTAVRMDRAGMDAVEKLSSFELMGRARLGETELCGIYPMLVALDAADKAGADTVRLFGYKNSGDVTGERGSVVGYAAMGIYKGGGPAARALGERERSELIRIARDTVDGLVRTGKAPEARHDDPALAISRGAFVTLKKDGELRGCIGSLFGEGPLLDTVRDMAVEAASRDFRFHAVTRDELSEIKVEISVLSPLRRPASVNDIQVGRDGIYIVKGASSGVLLPQVPVEYGWDRETFLMETCRKAGLPSGAWRQGADIYVFTADVFGE